MFGTSTRLAAFAVILAAALPTILATPSGTEKRQIFDLGGLTVNLGQMAEALAQPGFDDGAVVAAASQAARIKARTIRRRAAQYQVNLCPGFFQACSLPSGSYECLDTTQELNACGACLEEGGMDCEKIPFIENVSCAASKCEIHSCIEGYRPNLDKTACIPQNATRRYHKRRH